ncbi:MAG: sn-glycerol-3-phosphate ABC transporter ATP-binding protein UgpC [Desulfobacterales bacterium]|nr:sn-glycerol-3-phosphate ABC transporter ATP-binding protein UgpC [Desulfobacterales bacterium]
MASLVIDNVTKAFGRVQVLKGIDIAVDAGEFLVLVGPSGCGKSTLLNLIAGLESITTGEIRMGDRVVNNIPPKDRDIAMVFQSYALYPNMNVRRNLSFGLETRKVPRAEIENRIQRVAEILQIENLLERKPSQLSGGQRQRVAMGRAIAREPLIFLFDEPLSNLDAKLRVEMRTEIKKLHQRLGTTIVYVTHDQIEAMTLADRIAIMKDGIVQQFDTPDGVYANPANLFVAGFIGSPAMNFIPVSLSRENGHLVAPLVTADGRRFTVPVPADTGALAPEREIIMGIRPENITDFQEGMQSWAHIAALECGVNVVEPTGPDTLVYTEVNQTQIVCRLCPDAAPKAGDTIRLAFDTTKPLFFEPGTGNRIEG